MAHTPLAVQNIDRDGLDPVYDAAVSNGHSIRTSGREFIHVKNGDTVAHSVTITTPTVVLGLAVDDLVVSIPAGAERMIGPFPSATFGNPVEINYSAITAVTIGAFRA